ncbi:Uncharacterized protein Fot_11110 [Forsythia ovata]|uniref:Uncharacterized protein n=1 Tax=Forsythia ovata TaxID=205694 RepID=A0ABD1WJG4_9LAMI
MQFHINEFKKSKSSWVPIIGDAKEIREELRGLRPSQSGQYEKYRLEESNVVSRLEHTDIAELKNFVFDSEISTLNKLPIKRSNPLIVEDGGSNNDILDGDPTIQMSSNMIRKILKE